MKCNMIIFGSGKIGQEVLGFFGAENVECFCDNNHKLVGAKRCGKTIISFDELKRNYDSSIVMIAVDEFDSYAIAKQCKENEISDYVFWGFLREKFPQWDSGQMLEFIAISVNRSRIREDFWFKKVKVLQKQVDYFKTHADIRKIKPARGKLRSRQLECVQVSTEFFEKISGLGIKPILYGGCLLGYVRHNGFIPWDDDMDFALIRDEYERLKEFCRKYICEENGSRSGAETDRDKNVADGLKDYFWSNKYNYFCIFKQLPDNRRVYIEFFSLDYYAEDFQFQKLKKYAEKHIEELTRLVSDEEKIIYVEKALAENRQNAVKESESLFFGIDNMEFLMRRYPRERFIPKEVVFPLKKIMFERENFWVPNDAEKLLEYEYWDIWDFPQDVGLQRHCEIDEEESDCV